MKIAIIGAGLGGLSASCLLANRGHDVSVFEKNESPGGKINQIKSHGFRFDTGPSLLTMPDLLKSLFNRCNASFDNYLSLQQVEPICRYFYNDETIFDCYQETKKTLDEIGKIAPADQQNYEKFLEYAADLYKRTKDAFLFNPLYNLSDLSRLNLFDFMKINAFQTVANRVDNQFDSDYLQQFFKRFSTYNGSSPYQAPATLNVIPHVELSLGGYYVKDGMYNVATALYKLAQKQGVRFNFNREISKINVENGRARSIQVTGGKEYKADIIISNSDASETYLQLLPPAALSTRKRHSIQSVEPSCSGFVLLLGINRKYEALQHHNIFFSNDYRKEFRQIFKNRKMPVDPTIYIANTSFSDPKHAIRGGSNLFILINAPYLSEQWNWEKHQASYTNLIIDKLDERGLSDLKRSIIYKKEITPVDFYTRYRSNRGSIYGTSSNDKMAAFLRPKNKARAVGGLYLVGGSTHPGGGIPLVIQSVFNAVELIERYEEI